jgi:hypothetical protein
MLDNQWKRGHNSKKKNVTFFFNLKIIFTCKKEKFEDTKSQKEWVIVVLR